MASIKSTVILAIIAALILLTLAFLSFACTIGLGVVGIIAATRDNVCQGDTIALGCIPVEDDELPADANVTALQPSLPVRVVEDIRNSQYYLYWLGGATISGLLFVFVGSFCVWIAARVIHDAKGKETYQLLDFNEGSTSDNDEGVMLNQKVWMEIEGIEELRRAARDPENWRKYKSGPGSNPIRIEDGLYELVDEYDEKLHVNLLRLPSLVGLCVSFLCGILSILCLLWSFAIAFNRTKRYEDTVAPFVLANILSGIIAPILFFISAFIGINIFDYFTNNKVEAHLILTKFLPCLTYEVGDEKEFWVISDSLCLEIKRDSINDFILPQFRDSKFCKNCMPTYTTALLSIIIVLTIMVSFSYFIDITLVSQVTVTSCSDSNINIQYSCFKAGSLAQVDCTLNNETQQLHCFRFYRFGVDVDFITSVASAFAFYLLSTRIFSGIIFFMKFSRMSKKNTKKQGNAFFIAGLVFLLMAGILVLLWLSGVALESFSLVAHMDILNLAQLTMFAMFILIVGLLAREGKWKEKRPARRKRVKFEKPENGDDGNPAGNDNTEDGGKTADSKKPAGEINYTAAV